MKNTAPFVLCLLCIVLFSTCRKENACDCVKGTGNVISELRNTAPFTKIYVEDRINVILTEDTTQAEEVVVEAGEHLIGLIKTEVIDGELRIVNHNRCNFVRRYDVPITVYIRVRNDIVLITNNGTGNITNTNTCTCPYIDLNTISAGDITLTVDAGDVYTHQHSQGDITLTGTANDVIIYNTGGGFSITDQCSTPYAWVYTRTTGKITVAPVDLLISEIDGPGNVYYAGQPAQINSVLENTGLLLPL